jgi:ElaB/YqjD/DUF883 family membrane-anchored ribosome-binding protein
MSEAVVSDGGQAGGGSTVDEGKALVQEQAQAARDAAGERVGQQVEAGAAQLGEQVLEVVKGFTRTSHSLRAEGKDQPAAVLEGISKRAESFGNYLTQRSPGRMLNDFEHFGRRRPWIAIAGGVAVGLAASRFLKASGSRRFEELRAQGYSSRSAQWSPPQGERSGTHAVSPVIPHGPELG